MNENYKKTPDGRYILPLDIWCDEIHKIVGKTHSPKWKEYFILSDTIEFNFNLHNSFIPLEKHFEHIQLRKNDIFHILDDPVWDWSYEQRLKFIEFYSTYT